jgi:hypothetical protein
MISLDRHPDISSFSLANRYADVYGPVAQSSPQKLHHLSGQKFASTGNDRRVVQVHVIGPRTIGSGAHKFNQTLRVCCKKISESSGRLGANADCAAPNAEGVVHGSVFVRRHRKLIFDELVDAIFLLIHLSENLVDATNQALGNLFSLCWRSHRIFLVALF